MVIEVDKTWLVVGVSPNQLTTLHTMPAGELPEGASPARLGLRGQAGPGAQAPLARDPHEFPQTHDLLRAGRGMLPMLGAAALLGLALFPAGVVAQATLPALTATPGPNGSETYSLSMQTMLLMTSLSFLPAALLMMTGFTRIIIVLGLLRSAMGTAMSPPNHVLIGLALFLTFYTMSPVFDKIYADAYKPLSEGSIQFETAVERAAGPLRTFMLHQTRENDLALFANLAKQPALE